MEEFTDMKNRTDNPVYYEGDLNYVDVGLREKEAYTAVMEEMSKSDMFIDREATSRGAKETDSNRWMKLTLIGLVVFHILLMILAITTAVLLFTVTSSMQEDIDRLTKESDGHRASIAHLQARLSSHSSSINQIVSIVISNVFTIFKILYFRITKLMACKFH